MSHSDSPPGTSLMKSLPAFLTTARATQRRKRNTMTATSWGGGTGLIRSPSEDSEDVCLFEAKNKKSKEAGRWTPVNTLLEARLSGRLCRRPGGSELPLVYPAGRPRWFGGSG